MDFDYIKCGDCIQLMSELPDKSIDVIITSPPYNKKFFNKNKKTNQIWSQFEITYSSFSDDMPIEDYENWMIQFINLSMQKLKPHGSLFLNHKPIRANNQVYMPLNFILRSNAKIYQEIIWDRKNSPNIRNDVLVPCTERIYWLVNDKPTVYRNALPKDFISEVWHISPKPCKEHPAPFPVELPEYCMLLSSKEGAIVLDPFIGIGNTAVACVKNNRHYIGFDIDEEYCKLSEMNVKYVTEESK